MRICLVHEEYPEETNFGGIATYHKNLAEELVKIGHTVYVICRGLKQNKFYVQNGVFIHRIHVFETNKKKESIKYRKKISKILRYLQDNRLIDIIEVPDWGAETIFFEKYRKIPLIIRLHTPLKIWLKYNNNDFGENKNLLLKWEKKMLENNCYLSSCSNLLKKMIIDEFNINSNNVDVIYNPINTNNFYMEKELVKKNQIIFIGSLEERKGVLVFAKALNIIFKKYPKLKVVFIGKDTMRNNKNISSIKYIYKIVNNKYKNNLIFLGQLKNSEINSYLNYSKIAVFPSLFDNFPYVVLETMLTGTHIVGSFNSGMREMLEDQDSLYKAGDYKDLANKIIYKYELCKKEKYDLNNIKKVNLNFNSKKISEEMINFYERCIIDYYKKNISKFELQTVLNEITSENIIGIKKLKGGVANLIYLVKTSKKKYVIKKYLYNYNFVLADKLYNLYEKNNINVIRPINKELIKYNYYTYNIFEYKKSKKIRNIDNNLFKKILNCESKTKEKNNLNEKCDNYYNYLKKINKYNNLPEKDVLFVMDVYSGLKDNKIIKQRYLNHGDLSKNNILRSSNNFYVIDFDEVTVTSQLYDFAVIVVKNFIKFGKININKYEKLKKEINISSKYNDDDFHNIIKFYLCKILLEKFYYHQINKIDLYSKQQKKDDFLKYIYILKKFDKRCN